MCTNKNNKNNNKWVICVPLNSGVEGIGIATGSGRQNQIVIGESIDTALMDSIPIDDVEQLSQFKNKREENNDNDDGGVDDENGEDNHDDEAFLKVSEYI